jgi:branched-subunit amino acid ABC-type transport system permease component
MDIILGQIVSGLMRASFLFLVTVGLTLIYGVLSVLNVAHVSFYMLGAYFTCTFWKLLQAYDFSYWVAIPATCITMAGIGLIIELVLMRRLYSRIQPEVLLATFALIYIFSDVAKLTWGTQMYSIPDKPAILTKFLFTIGMIPLPSTIAFTVGVAVLVGAALWIWLHKTMFGKIVRATQFDREMVSALGIPVPRIYSSVFSISALLAGLAGAVWMATGIVQPGRLDIPMLPQVFCVMVIGGMGSLVGTAVASVIVGETFALSILIEPRAGMMALFVVTGLVLIVLPWGLFGTKGRLE